MYIGPWQEFALGRALARPVRAAPAGPSQRQLPPITRPADESYANSSSAGATDELQQFVAAFKEAAANMDEERASNLLRWSPLFLPTVQSLMQPAQAPGGMSASLRGSAAALRPTHRSERTLQQQKKASIRAQRERHIQEMRTLYSLSGKGGGSNPATSDPQWAFGAAAGHVSPRRPGVEQALPLPNIGSCTCLSPQKPSMFSMPPPRGAAALSTPRISVSTAVAGEGGHSPGSYLEVAAYVHPHAEASVNAQRRAGERGMGPRTPGSPASHSPSLAAPHLLPHIGGGSRGSYHNPRCGFGTAGGGGGGGSPVSRGSANPWGKMRDDDWEEEVDDLLEWTKSLPGFA
jgi:hypothetical protein